MPFKAHFRQEYWSVDVRYIEEHNLGFPEPVYLLSVLENYSPGVCLASKISATAKSMGLSSGPLCSALGLWCPFGSCQRWRCDLLLQSGDGRVRRALDQERADRIGAALAKLCGVALQYRPKNGRREICTGTLLGRADCHASYLDARLQYAAPLGA